MTRAQLACLACGRGIPYGRLCTPCLTKVLNILGDYAGPPHRGTGHKGRSLDLFTDVDAVITKQARSERQPGGAAIGRAQPLPLNAWAITKRDEAESALFAWWRIWVEATRATSNVVNAQGMAADLIRARAWIQADDAAHELLDDLERSHEALTRAVDRPQPAVYLGPCAAVDLDDQTCPGDVYQRQDEGPKCLRCGAVYSHDERVEWIHTMAQDELVTASEAARYLSAWGTRITANLVASWAARHRITDRGATHDGARLYRFGDIRDMALKHKPRQPKEGTA